MPGSVLVSCLPVVCGTNQNLPRIYLQARAVKQHRRGIKVAVRGVSVVCTRRRRRKGESVVLLSALELESSPCSGHGTGGRSSCARVLIPG